MTCARINTCSYTLAHLVSPLPSRPSRSRRCTQLTPSPGCPARSSSVRPLPPPPASSQRFGSGTRRRCPQQGSRNISGRGPQVSPHRHNVRRSRRSPSFPLPSCRRWSGAGRWGRREEEEGREKEQEG